MTRRPAAPNAVTRPVVEYLPDPHGGALFAALTGAAASGLNGARAVVRPSATWGGWTRTLQQFRGAAQLGNGRVIAQKNSDLNREKTAQSTTAAIFGDRMRRGQS
jgi:hypothetical protein